MKPKIIPDDTKLPVLLSSEEVALIREETFLEPEMLACALVEKKNSRYSWTLGEIDYVGGFIAASSNHTEDKKLRKRLRALFAKLQDILDSHIEESDAAS